MRPSRSKNPASPSAWKMPAEDRRRQRSAGVDSPKFDSWAEGDMSRLPNGATRKTGTRGTSGKSKKYS